MDEDEDDYVSYGTPLPELEDEATLRKKAAKELQVRDEKGRQRFHGAFTGGFSAGYFNTVGTKEGWAPSTFISSRSNVADRLQQNPEDFMDDEDLGEFGIATRRIHTTSNFQDESQLNIKKRKLISADAIIPGEAPLKDIVQAVRESIGIQILKKLGWRDGQGIGPRVKKQSAGTKVYGCSPFPNADTPEEDDPTALSYTFAPKDTDAIFYKPKDDCFGLGYTGLSKESILGVRSDPFAPTSTKSWLAKDKKKISITGQAFGVGAFEDDDEDIYSRDDMTQYDFSELAPKGYQDLQNTTEAKKSETSSDIIEGFVLASQPPSVKKHYPAPVLPPNFKPIHLKFTSTSSAAPKVNLEKSRHALSASDRSIILGEKRFHKPPSSGTTCINTEKKNATQMQALPHTSEAAVPASVIPLNFRPFPNDVDKQQRYEEYLRLKKEGGIGRLKQPSSMTEWEKQQEVEEFSKAAVLFKPLSDALSSRFESRSHLSVEHEVMAELEKIKKEKELKPTEIIRNIVGLRNRKSFEWHPVSLLCRRMNVPNPYPNSSSGGTQSIHKTKSVFAHLSFTSNKSHTPEESSIPLTPHIDPENKSNDGTEGASDEPPPPGTENLDMHFSFANKELPPSENKKPPIDLFKDIFGNSSSEEEEDSPTDEKTEMLDENKTSENEIEIIELKDMEKHSITTDDAAKLIAREKADEISSGDKSKLQKPSTEIKKIGFGVFANLDLDALNKRKPVDRSVLQNNLISGNDKCDAQSATNKNHSEVQIEDSKTDDAYGPELPPNFSSVVSPASTTYKADYKKHEKHKSKHKHKHHKHKSKKKKKKKSSRRDSDTSESSDELEEVPPTLIIEKLKKLQKWKS